MSINGQTVSGTASAAAIDTGTSLMYLPSAAAQAFYTTLSPEAKQADTSGHWALPCNTPVFQLAVVIGGTSYQISMKDFVTGFADATRQFCIGAIIGQDAKDPQGAVISIRACCSSPQLAE